MYLSGRLKSAGGFTLIELMMTLVIFAILLTLGIPSFNIMIKNTQIRSTAEGILDGLQTARTEAVRRSGYTQLILGPGAAWRIVRLAPPVIGKEENGVAYAPCQIIETVQSSVAEGAGGATTITITPAGLSSVTFNSLGWVASGTNSCGDSIDQVRVDSTALSAADSRELDIQISSGGGLRLCDPQVASGDPRACN